MKIRVTVLPKYDFGAVRLDIRLGYKYVLLCFHFLRFHYIRIGMNIHGYICNTTTYQI